MSNAANTATAAEASSTTTAQAHDVPRQLFNESGGGRLRLRKVSLTTHAPAPSPAVISSHQKKPESNVVKNSILAGSISGIVSTIFLYPMDLIRTKMQAEGSGVGVGGTAQHRHRGPIQVVRHTIQHGGFRALYTGMTLPLAAQAVYKGTVFSVNNVVQQYIVDRKTLENHKSSGIIANTTPGQLTMLDRFNCGFVAGAVNGALFVTPVEFVRNQMIAQHSKLAAGQQQSSRLAMGNWDVIRHCIQNHGIFSLWRGVGMTIARDGIGVGCFFYSMAWTEQQLTPPGQAPSVASTLISGAVAGLAYWVSSLPLDTIKTWQQSADLSVRFSVTDSLQKIYRETGPIGLAQRLLRGWQVAYFRGMPSAAITYSVYSFAYRHLQHAG